jgi:hypothetical protein
MYEFRLCCTSSKGTSVFSFPSRRAKTNKVQVPLSTNAPLIMKIKDSAVTLRIALPAQEVDASPILRLHVETKDVVKKSAQYIRSSFDVVFDCKYIIEPLRPGGTYQFRVCGESIQGRGPLSQWSDNAVIPYGKSSSFK